MKKFSKFLAIALALTLIFASMPAAFAAGTEPGKTVSVSFSFQGIYGVDGTFTFSNPSILSDISYSYSGGLNGSINNNVAYFYGNQATDFTITVTAKVVASAKNGDSCDISFTYETSDQNGDMSSWKTSTRTITVEVHECKDANKNHKCDGCGAKLSNCVDNNKDNKCDICGAKLEDPIDYTELDKQIKKADELKKNEYTAESWNEFTKVLEKAKEARANGKQADVDAAAKNLADAFGKLVKMDYSKLQAALEAAKTVGDETVSSLIQRLIAAIEAANKALESNDQAAVDAATAELEAVTAELEKALNELKTTEIVEVEVEVEKEVVVEVEPSEPFCNISWHDLILILLIVSVVLNVVLIVVPVIKKKK